MRRNDVVAVSPKSSWSQRVVGLLVVAFGLVVFGEGRNAGAATTTITANCATVAPGNTRLVSIPPGDTLEILKGNCLGIKAGFVNYTTFYDFNTYLLKADQADPAVYQQNNVPYTGPQWAHVGYQLTHSNGSYSTLSYRAVFKSVTKGTYIIWLRIGSGLQPAQTITVTVEDAGSPFTTTYDPVITGTATVGQTLTASTTAWDPVADSMTYQWFAGGTAISGATNSTYVLQPADAGKTVTVKVTGVKATFKTTTKESAATSAVASIPFTTTADPTIIGDPVVGKTLTASTTTGWSPTPTSWTYQWYSGVDPITGATSSTYVIDVAHRNKQLSVKVSGSAQGYITADRTSSLTAPVSLPTGLTVTYKANATGTTGSVPVDSSTYTMLDDFTIKSAGTLERSGYTFDSWNTQSDGKGTRYTSGNVATMGLTSVDLYAQWTPITYTITFEVGGVATGQQATFSTGGSTTLASAPTPASADTGKRFVGWFTDAALTQLAAAPGGTFTPLGIGNLTLYGKWENYVLKYSTVTSPYGCQISDTTFRWGDTLILPAVPAGCESIRIEGWYSNSNFATRIGAVGGQYTPTGSPGDLTLYAKTVARHTTWWKMSDPRNSEKRLYEIGDTVTLPVAPKYPNKEFMYWRDNSGYFVSGEPRAITKDFIFDKAQTHTFEAKYRSWLRFDMNGGTGGPADIAVIASSFDSPYTSFGSPIPTRTGYTFSHWEDPNGVSRTAINLAGDTTVTAQWTANKYTVTYETYGGTSFANGSTETDAAIAASPGSPTRGRDIFKGWFTAKTGGTKVTFPYLHNRLADFTLHAQWVTDQVPLVINGSVAETYGSTTTLTASGGSTAAGLVWSDGSSTACTVDSNGVVTMTSGTGTCEITVSKAGDEDYFDAISAPHVITVSKAAQDALTVTSKETSYGETLLLIATGGSGTGEVSWQKISGTCTLDDNRLTPGNAGSECVVRATRAADANYSSKNSTNTTIVIKKASQTGFRINMASSFTTGGSLPLSSTGGKSTGAVTWTLTSGQCVMSNSALTASRGGITCVVESTHAGDANYFSATDTLTITVNKVPQFLTFRSSAPSPATPGSTYTVTVESDVFLAPTVVIANSSASVCSIAANVVTFNAVGTCLISASQAGDNVYASAAASQSVSVTNPPPPQDSGNAIGSSGSATSVPQSLIKAPTTTVATQGTTTTTTTTTTTIPTIGVLDTSAATDVETGEAEAFVRGQSVKTTIEHVNDTLVITLPNKVKVSFGKVDKTSNATPVASDGVLRVFRRDQIDVQVLGVVPSTTYSISLFPNSVGLGRGVANENGQVNTRVITPSNAKYGGHTLQVNGVGPKNEVVTVSLGIEVLKKDSNTLAAIIAITSAILLALLGGRSFVFGWRRNREEDESDDTVTS